LQAKLVLAPGETRQVIYMMGIGAPDAEWDDGDGVVHRPGRELLAEYGTPERVDAELAAIRVPTLVIAGTHDLSTPPVDGHFIADHVPGARYVELDAAHISNVEQPAGFLAALVGHLTA
jgi:pimeloyl-ACP methyl ester carboxylesterase